MRAERRAGSLLVRDEPRFLRVTLFAFGAAAALAALNQSAADPTRLALGGLGSLFCFAWAGILETVRFELDEARRVLRWSRRSLFRRRAGDVQFHEIRGVHARVREDRGELVAALRLARETGGLSPEAAKQLVDELREKLSPGSR